jgi:hypothetical protein
MDNISRIMLLVSIVSSLLVIYISITNIDNFCIMLILAIISFISNLIMTWNNYKLNK